MLASQCRVALDRAGVSDGRLLLAVSGGVDSCVLLDLLLGIAPDLDLELIVAHVDHRLRGEASQADAAFVADRAARAGLPFVSRCVDPERLREGQSSRSRPTLEEAARTLRRRALLEMATEENARWIATAHHAGDQAETVLLRVLRGTGPEGLGAMAPLSPDGRWVRPLLAVDPGHLVAHARARRLEWREDDSNRDRSFTRNRLRLDWMSELAGTFNPQLLRTLCNLAEAQRTDSEWMEALVEDAAEGRIEVGQDAIRLAFEDWDALPEALARRLVRRALFAAGLERDVSRVHLSRVLDFLRRGRAVGRNKRLELPRGLVLRRADDGFVLGPLHP